MRAFKKIIMNEYIFRLKLTTKKKSTEWQFNLQLKKNIGIINHGLSLLLIHVLTCNTLSSCIYSRIFRVKAMS